MRSNQTFDFPTQDTLDQVASGSLSISHPLHRIGKKLFEGGIGVRHIVVAEGDTHDAGLGVLHHPYARDGFLSFVRGVVTADVNVVGGLQLDPVILVGDLESFRNLLGDGMAGITHGHLKQATAMAGSAATHEAVIVALPWMLPCRSV